jgi:hypothetical protein
MFLRDAVVIKYYLRTQIINFAPALGHRRYIEINLLLPLVSSSVTSFLRLLEESSVYRLCVVFLLLDIRISVRQLCSAV